MIRLTYTNPDGVSIIFGPPGSKFLITSVEGLDSPDLDVQTQKAPYQDGVTLIDQLYAPRIITIEGAIDAPNDFTSIRTYRRTIETTLNSKLGAGVLTYYNGASTYTIPALPQSSPKYPWKDFAVDPFQRYLITFFCADPYWYASTTQSLTLGNVLSLLSFPMEFPIEFSSVGSGLLIGTAANSGDVSTPVSIVIYGPTTNPTIKNNTTGEQIRILYSLVSGDRIMITTNFGSKSIIVNGSNGSQYLTLSSSFWSLVPGSNELEVTDDNGFPLGSATITWANRYGGV